MPVSIKIPRFLGPATAALARLPRRLLRDRHGGTLVMVGLALPVVFGMTGLGLDSALWYFERRVMQSAVDTAAIAATLTKASGGDMDAIRAAVIESLAANKFVLKGTDVLSVNVPPTQGPNTGNTTAVEVILQRPATVNLARMVTTDTMMIRTRAVGGSVVVGEHCVVALDPGADKALEFTGNAVVDIDCGVASNSNSDKAIYVDGNATLTADPAQAFGDIYVGGSAVLNTAHPPQPHSPAVPDPFASLQIPPLGACAPSPDLTGPPGPPIVMNPGHYCGDLAIQNKTVTLNPGTYYIDEGDLVVLANSDITGDGVTFVFTGDDKSQVGTFEITSLADVDLTAPSTGDYAGVVFFTDPLADSNNGTGSPYKNIVTGSANTEIKGAIYAPSRETVFMGGPSVTWQCLQIVSRKVTLTGDGHIANDAAACQAVGLDPVQQTRIRLIE